MRVDAESITGLVAATRPVVTAVVPKLADDGHNGQAKGPEDCSPGPWSREVARYLAALLIARTVAGAATVSTRAASSLLAALLRSAGLTMW